MMIMTATGMRCLRKRNNNNNNNNNNLLRMMTFRVSQQGERESYNFELLTCYVCTIQFLVVLCYEIERQL